MSNFFKRQLTKRAPDVWDSAAFSSIFLASSFSCSQAESTPAHTQVTQTVRRSFPSRESRKNEVTNRDNRNSCNYLIFLHACITASLNPNPVSNRCYCTYCCLYFYAYYDFNFIANINNDNTPRFRNRFTAVTNDYPKCDTSGTARRYKKRYTSIF